MHIFVDVVCGGLPPIRQSDRQTAAARSSPSPSSTGERGELTNDSSSANRAHHHRRRKSGDVAAKNTEGVVFWRAASDTVVVDEKHNS